MKKFNLVPINEESPSYMDGFTKLAYKTGTRMRQIDWDKVKKIIDSKEYEQIEVGLAEDYACTMSIIYQNGKVNIEENPIASFWGSSRWATPAIKLYKDGKSELFECWIDGNKHTFPNWLIEEDK